MEITEHIKEVRQVGNSGGVLVPKEWLGKQVKVTLIDRTREIKKEAFKILDPYLKDIYGIYLVGSYSRNEQTRESDVDILVISNKTRKTILSGKYSVEIYTLDGIKNTLKKDPIMVYPRLFEAKALLNEGLLNELKSIKIAASSFKIFFEDCLRAIKINKEFIALDKLDGDTLESVEAVAYSTMLRLRGIYMVKSFLERKPYSNDKFKRWVLDSSEISQSDFDEFYGAYSDVKLNKIPKKRIKIKSAETLINLLEKEVKRYAKKK